MLLCGLSDANFLILGWMVVQLLWVSLRYSLVGSLVFRGLLFGV